MTPAEEALQTAIAVAKQQATRSFELRAALSLAKLYQSTGRPADAHAALAPAREGFSSTPEMTEIAEAQALLAASEPVAAELRRRETRSKLHAGYALATMMTKGFAAEETKAALAKAASASGVARTPEYWTIIYGRINADMMSGDHRAASAGVEAEAPVCWTMPPSRCGCAVSSNYLPAICLVPAPIASGRSPITTKRRDETLRTLFALDLRSNALMHLGYLAWHPRRLRGRRAPH